MQEVDDDFESGGEGRAENFDMDVSGSDGEFSTRSSVAARKGRAASASVSRKTSVQPPSVGAAGKRKAAKPAVAVDNDSDEDGFGGFRRKRLKRG